MYDVIDVTLGSPVAKNGTFTVSYPAGKYSGSYAPFGHKFYSEKLQKVFSQDAGTCSVAFTTLATFTYTGNTTIPAGTKVKVQLNLWGKDDRGAVRQEHPRVVPYGLYRVSLGVPIAADDDGICESQTTEAAGDLLINGLLASGGEVVLDVPRAVTVDSGDADDAVITVYGEDEYGQPMVEAITMNGTTGVNGKKAFKKIFRVHASKAVANGGFVGTNTIIGLPVFLPATTAVGTIVGDLENGTFDSTLDGTLVAGVQTKPTATTGDVRGTYVPGASLNGATEIAILVYLTDPTYKGVNQFAG